MSKRIGLLLFTLMAWSVFAFAQTGNVEGTVLLAPDGGGAAGATVVMERNMWPNDSLVTTTDAEGHFTFEDIAAGHWAASAHLEGHFPGFAMVFVPPDGGTVFPVIILGPPIGEAGAVSGVVLTADGEAAAGAHVSLAQLRDPMHPHGFMAMVDADAAGEFGFDPVPPGLYTISAGLMGEGFAAALIEVLPNQTTEVTLTLEHHNGGGHGDSLVVVDLTGTAIVVVDGDSLHPRTHYFLDVDADGEADYRLAFGPPWYDPNGPDEEPNRPQDGAEITITGGLLTYGDPQIVVVFEINGMFWRDPRHGPGHGGWHDWNCDPDSLEGIEVEGTAMVHIGGGFHQDNRYAIDVDADGVFDYRLSFGPPWYDPNGPDELPNRPLDGDDISIVGGLMNCPNMEFDVIIVYEINGMFWREPGDTTGFSPQELDAGDPVVIGVPSEYLTASNYPNPFNPVTTISYGLPVNGDVSLKVFDIVGREVATLVNGYQIAGTYQVDWNAANLPSGIYLYRVTVAGQSFTNRMVLMK